MKTPHLKVYQTRIGLSEWVVAAPNQMAALNAWDVRENLFTQGAAKETKDPEAISLALKAGGQPVAFRTYKLRDADLAEIGKPARPTSKTPAASPTRPGPSRVSSAPSKSRIAAAPPPKPLDRTKLDAAEDALKEFQKQAARQRAAIEKRRVSMEHQLELEVRKLDGQEQAIVARVDRERRRYEEMS